MGHANDCIIKMKHIFLTVVLFVLLTLTGFTQKKQENQGDIRSFRVMFYNVENLFDIYDDSLTADEEFTPEGERRWNNKRFYTKINNIGKVIMAAGEWKPPSIIGLCEIENRFVLERLIYDTPLKKPGYKIVHHNSPDHRGIDVALLYREEDFVLFSDTTIPVGFAFDTASATRDILYVKGLIGGSEMLHIFINHWPSRFGGYMNTREKRNAVASLLRKHTDSLMAINPNVSIVIMGDFNDDPTDESLAGILGTKIPDEKENPSGLYNLMLKKQDDWPDGSLKFRETWNTFDQIIVSEGLLNPESAITVSQDGGRIFHAPFLLENDETYLGIKPCRTFNGYKYQGGFSDHLPVFVDLILFSD